MKKQAIVITLLLTSIFASGQDQFSNFGNLQTFTGASVTFFGDLRNDGTITDSGQGVMFKGSSSHTISGSSVTTLSNLTISDVNGLTMQQNMIVSNSLTLTSGPLVLNSKTLTISNTSPTAITRTSGYIRSESTNNSSKMIWNISTNNGAHIFPFGTSAGAYIPFTLTVTAGNIGNVTVSTYSTAANNLPYPTSPVAVTNLNVGGIDNSANVVDRFWQIDKDGPSGTATITFTASAAEVGTIANIKAQRWNSATSSWDAPLPTQSSSAFGATVTGVTAFSPWVASGNDVSLPVELTNFTATLIDSDVELKWETASEINNEYFTVQRSIDGKNFSDIGKVDGAGTTSSVQKYNFLDFNAFVGRSYYRLKQTDFDGTYQFSGVRQIEFDNKPQLRLTAFPNPVTDHKFSIDFHSGYDGPIAVGIYDILGRIVFYGDVKANISTYEVNLNSDLPSGVYILKASNGVLSTEQSLIVE
jgi:hypothetical protein